MPLAKVGWKNRFEKKLTKKDAHYRAGLVAGAKLLEFFGDAATALCLRESGYEGLFRAYQKIDFLAPAYAGDTVTVTAVIIRVGKTSRDMHFKAYKKRTLLCEAWGTVVIPELQMVS